MVHHWAIWNINSDNEVLFDAVLEKHGKDEILLYKRRLAKGFIFSLIQVNLLISIFCYPFFNSIFFFLVDLL